MTITSSIKKMANSTGVSSRNVILLTLAVGLAAQIPTSTQAIQDPVIRSIVQAVVLFVVIFTSIKVLPSEKIPKSPGTMAPDSQPDTIPDNPPPIKRA